MVAAAAVAVNNQSNINKKQASQRMPVFYLYNWTAFLQYKKELFPQTTNIMLIL